MIAVLQRVKRASVSVEGEVTGRDSLSVDYLLQHRFLNPTSDVVHLSNPTHHIGARHLSLSPQLQSLHLQSVSVQSRQ